MTLKLIYILIKKTNKNIFLVLLTSNDDIKVEIYKSEVKKVVHPLITFFYLLL